MPVPPKLDQKAMAQKLSEAEQLQRQFKTCGGVAALAAKVQGARHENMGSRSASSFQEPTRSMLLAAQENTMVPPAMTSSGIELYAVCGRKVIKAAELKRNQLANEERQGAFERLSRNHLRKLMDNAIIENR
jgi:peptidyl-prolyl cis-trans isomerase SurA